MDFLETSKERAEFSTSTPNSNYLTGESQDLIFTLFMFFLVLCLVLVVWKNNDESFGSCLFLPFSHPRTNDEIDLEKGFFLLKK